MEGYRVVDPLTTSREIGSTMYVLRIEKGMT